MYSLEGNELGAAGAGALAEALKLNAVLKSINLSRNHIGGYYDEARDEMVYTPGGPAAIAEMLKLNAVVKKLLLGGNSIGDDGAIALSESLKSNKSLEKLALNSNGIGDKGGKALASALGTAVLTTIGCAFCA